MQQYQLAGNAYGASTPNANWPNANVYVPAQPGYTGLMGLSSLSCITGGYFTQTEIRETFIHELTHSQLPLVLEPTLTGSMYGPDGSHSLDELLPSRNSAFDEGIANAFGFWYALPSDASVTRALNRNDTLIAETILGCSGAGGHCIQNRLAADSVAVLGTCFPQHNCYLIRDISPEILMHNEMIISNVLYQAMAQFRSTYILSRAAKSASSDIAAGGNFGFEPLFKELTKRANNYHNRGNPEGTRTLGQFMPVAILDYYTGYKIDSKATLESVLGTTWAATDTNIDDYFSRHRATLTGFRPNATTWHVGDQISRLSEHLHVRSPRANRTSASNN